MNTSDTHPYILELAEKLRNLEKAEAALHDAQCAVSDYSTELISTILKEEMTACSVLSINRSKLKRWIRNNK